MHISYKSFTILINDLETKINRSLQVKTKKIPTVIIMHISCKSFPYTHVAKEKKNIHFVSIHLYM